MTNPNQPSSQPEQLIDKVPGYTYEGVDTTGHPSLAPDVLTKIDNIPTSPTAGDDKVVPHINTREPIVVLKPGDPGYDEKLAQHQYNQGLMQAAADHLLGSGERKD